MITHREMSLWNWRLRVDVSLGSLVINIMSPDTIPYFITIADSILKHTNRQMKDGQVLLLPPPN